MNTHTYRHRHSYISQSGSLSFRKFFPLSSKCIGKEGVVCVGYPLSLHLYPTSWTVDLRTKTFLGRLGHPLNPSRPNSVFSSSQKILSRFTGYTMYLLNQSLLGRVSRPNNMCPQTLTRTPSVRFPESPTVFLRSSSTIHSPPESRPTPTSPEKSASRVFAVETNRQSLRQVPLVPYSIQFDREGRS